jgi:hypothetical protein
MGKDSAGEVGIMPKLVFCAAVAVAALTSCSSAATVVHAPAPTPAVTKTKVVTVTPTPAAKPTVARAKTVTQAPRPVASTPVASAPVASTSPPATPAAAASAGYLGNLFGGGTGNPCNFASGYQLGDCNPTGETEQQYIHDPGGPAPGTSTNAQGCYYVKMDEGYCPDTGQYIPMKDPNG